MSCRQTQFVYYKNVVSLTRGHISIAHSVAVPRETLLPFIWGFSISREPTLPCLCILPANFNRYLSFCCIYHTKLSSLLIRLAAIKDTDIGQGQHHSLSTAWVGTSSTKHESLLAILDLPCEHNRSNNCSECYPIKDFSCQAVSHAQIATTKLPW